MRDRRKTARRGDRRRTGRVGVNFRTKWHSITGSHEGRIEDLSASGCFVNTRDPAEVGDIVSLLIQLPSGRWLPIRGKVTFYQQLTGFSLSFSILKTETEAGPIGPCDEPGLATNI